MAQAFSHGDAEVAALRIPPHSVEAEQSVIGGLLLDNKAWDHIIGIVGEGDFYRDEHRRIFRQIARLIDKTRPADVVTVAEALDSAGDGEATGGLAYLGELAANTPSAANIRRYAEIVRDRAILRRLVTAGDEIAGLALNPMGRDPKSLLDEAEAKVFAIAESQTRQQGGFQQINPLLNEVVERIQELHDRDNPSDITGVPTGFVDLDHKTSGLQAGDLIIVAGRPSMGKTAFALNIAEHVAVEVGLPVGVFSMEMGSAQLAMRMLASIGRLDSHRVRTGRLTDDEWSRLSFALGKMHDKPLYIDESGSLNPIELRARARRLHRQCGKLGLIVVDYLQLMTTARQGENRATEISEISRSLKSLAKELAVPVVALSQLSRKVEERNDKRPLMSDLRECVVGETLVLLADGRRVPIRELVGATPEVWAVDAQQKVVAARADKVWSVGRRPVFDLLLASGRRLTATGEHRVLTGGGWMTLDEIVPGQRVALARSLPAARGANDWPDAHCVLLAHLIGDGSYLSGQPLRYTTGSEENSKAVAAAAETFGVTVNRHAGRGAWHQLVFSGNGNRWQAAGINKWLRELGVFDQRSAEKRIPQAVFRLDEKRVALFLRHLWATDGSIHVRPDHLRGSPRIYFASVSRGLAHDVAALLLRLGVVARIRTLMQPSGNPLYNVDVSGGTMQLRFLDTVGAFGPRREPAERLRAKLADSDSNPNVDTLPVEIFEAVRAAMRREGVTTRDMATLRGTSYGGSSHFRFAPSRPTLASYAELLKDETLRTWAESDLFWDKVVAVEPAGDAEVFDLTVPGPASWLADGVVTHNSGAIEQDADIILMMYREEYYKPDTQDKGTAEVIIGKQRNGPTGTVRMAFLGEYTRFENLAHGGPGR